MTKYVWQNDSWTSFRWDLEEVFVALMEAKKAQGYILAQSNFFDLKDLAEIITEEAYTTSSIEGEDLDRNTIRSSVAKRLGLPTAGLPEVKRNSDGLVEILMDATSGHGEILIKDRLFGWHAALFPTGYSGMFKIRVGNWRDQGTPMQVISGPMGKEKIHYIAPPSEVVPHEMDKFIDWWNNPPRKLDGMIRAAVAHFWFISIHPFEDGNGRIARCITDMALAQDENTSKRLYSLSSQIIEDKKKYYDILEKSQKGDGDITGWIVWFLEMFTQSIGSSKSLIDKSIFVGKFYEHLANLKLNERQSKVIKKLLEYFPDDFQGGLTNKKYVSITKTSSESAKRDLSDLLDKQILLANKGGGRSTSYRLNRDF
jgi:Fic family protein